MAQARNHCARGNNAAKDSSNINHVGRGAVCGKKRNGGGILAVAAGLAAALSINGGAFFRGGGAGAPLEEAGG